MTTPLVVAPIKKWFVSFVIVVVIVTLWSQAIWWLASSAFGSLIILNLQFLVFPNTADRHWLSRLSLGLVFALVLIANLKFIIVSAMVFH